MTDDDPRTVRTSPANRGQSETVAYVLLVGVAILAVTVLITFGAGTIDTSRSDAEVSQAENAMGEFDSRASLVAYEETRHQRVDLGLSANRGSLRTHPDDGWIRVRVVDVKNGSTDVTVTNTTLGSVAYEGDGRRIVYQGGGVWRTDGTRTRMVSPPDFDYEDGTLTLPVIALSGDRALDDGDVGITQRGPPVREFPNRSVGLTNKLDEGKITVTVRSEHYRAWGRYIRDQTNGSVYYDDPNETVTVVFLVYPDFASPINGIIATSGAGQLRLVGTGAYVDSYNSTEGPYDDSQSNNGTVKAAGNVTMSGDSTINGTVRAGEVVDLDSNSARINGDVHWTDGFENQGTVTGDVSQIDGVKGVDPVDTIVFEFLRRIRENNDNAETSVIQNGTLDISGSTAELDSGTYYLENLDLDGEKLVLNTSDGDVTIAVENWVRLRKNSGSNLTVEGDGVVRMYVGSNEEVEVQPTGEGKRDVNFHVGKTSTVHVPGDRSVQLRVFGPNTFNATITGSSSDPTSATGVIYAPGENTGPGYVYVKQGEVYGGIVTGNLTLGQYGAVHFDYAIADTDLPRTPQASRLEYLYVTVYRIEVSS